MVIFSLHINKLKKEEGHKKPSNPVTGVVLLLLLLFCFVFVSRIILFCT